MLGMTEERIDMQIYSLFARICRQCVDRRGNAKVELDPGTGAPLDAGSVTSRARALGGHSLALQYVMDPRRFAAGILRRTSDNAVEGGTLALNSIPDSEWTDEEHGFVNWLELQIKLRCHDLTEQLGHFNLRGVAGMDEGEVLPFGDDGLVQAVKITYKGLKHALEVTAGTEYETGPTSLEDDMGKQAMANAPEWLKQK